MANKTQVDLTDEQVKAIQTWEADKRALDVNKESEMFSRLHIVKALPWKADKEEGGQTIKLGAGWRLSLSKSMDYSIEKKDKDAVNFALGKLWELMRDNALLDPETAPQAHEIAVARIEALVRWEPVLSVTEWKKLSDTEKQLIAGVVTSKPGAPQIELKPPATPKG